jgi:alpha-tubulin suppressor-like RCC1 family protein
MSQLKTMIFTLMMLTVPLAGCTGDDGPVDVLGCTNVDANNYNENVTKDNGSCDYDLDDDGIQDRYEVGGCTDNTANNYMISATDYDGSCDYDLDDDGVLDADEILGCTDSAANNYKIRATDDDGSCDYDLDDDGVLDADEILGCTDSTANNYNSEATDEDGSCDYDLDIDITAGTQHTCAILDNGSVSCWGPNNFGQLGDGTNTPDLVRNTPTQTSSLGTDRTAVAISAGRYHTCALLDDGSVSCWGRNFFGQLGDGTTTDRNTPTQISSLGTDRTAVAISAGERHTCAILDDGSVSCWGGNNGGRLGDGTTTDRNTPTPTSSLGTGRTAIAITVGEGLGSHTCAILDDGSVSCWGYNTYGQLGDGTDTLRNTPTQTSSLGTDRTAVAITAGYRHTCAILDDGSVVCWGWNNNGVDGGGQLGDGTTTDHSTPTQTSTLGTDRTAIAIAAGGDHTCAILDDGSVSCWGNNSGGQLGDGTTTDRLTPTQTSSLGEGRTAVAITAGYWYTCAILDDGSVSCWGWNTYGQLGDGTTNDRFTPTAIEIR